MAARSRRSSDSMMARPHSEASSPLAAATRLTSQLRSLGLMGRKSFEFRRRRWKPAVLRLTGMERVTGIGGVFFKARDPAALAQWYRANLGIEVEASFGGAIFAATGETVWAPFPDDSSYFAKPFMINYRVSNLARMLAQLRAAGAQVDEKVQTESNGKFGWATDPEGNRVELWEPAQAP